ncbi:hypothetical protein E3P94_02541 [Wallemia ichthyophaga]|nr:hypothetical protein E3P95_02478 [Wallemia ichthyophaga]TIA99506.1 hypothetical protein E3P94_02541 [Wallemia ichthyophaga]
MVVLSQPATATAMSLEREEYDDNSEDSDILDADDGDYSSGKPSKPPKKDTGYSWESEYKRSWDVVAEDESGSLTTSVNAFIERNKRRRRLGGEAIQRAIIRHTLLVLDLSSAMSDRDMRPNRYLLSLEYAREYAREYFDQNPIGQLGCIAMRNGVAEWISKMTGSAHDITKALTNKNKLEPSGEPSLQNALEMGRASMTHLPTHASKEIVIVYGALTTCDPGNIHDTLRSLMNDKVRVNIISLAAEVRILREIAEKTGGTFYVALDEVHYKDILFETIPPPAIHKADTPNTLNTSNTSNTADLMQMVNYVEKAIYVRDAVSTSSQIISPLVSSCRLAGYNISSISDHHCLKFDQDCFILSPFSLLYNDSASTIAQFNQLPYAITTILFHDSHDHSLFFQNLSALDAHAVPSQSPHKEISIHRNPHSAYPSSLPYIFGIAYVLFIIYLSISVSRLHQVHSRFGLAITGIAQLCVSTIMSISLLELCDWRLRLIPWTVVPFVIVVVGVENMLTIARAVVSTSISLPVPERVGQGMAKVGPVIGMTVLSDLTLLAIAGYLLPGMIREFCIFASVVSVIDYFLQSTFFITILSVDIQRLELSDLIHQGIQPGATAPAHAHTHSPSDTPKKHTFTSNPLIIATKAVWKARSTRNASLLVLILIMSTLYYMTLPSQVHSHSHAHSQSHLDAPEHNYNHSPTFTFSQHVWSILSEDGAHAFVNIHINPPTFLTTYASQEKLDALEQQELFAPRTRAFLWSVKVVVLPIGSSLVALYCLLLFLLKDKELHELQRSKLDESVGMSRGGSGSNIDAQPPSEHQQLQPHRREENSQSNPRSKSHSLQINASVEVVDSVDIAHVASTPSLLAWCTVLDDVNVLHCGQRFLLTIPSQSEANNEANGPVATAKVTALVASNSLIAVGWTDGAVILWDMRSGVPVPRHLEGLRSGEDGESVDSSSPISPVPVSALEFRSSCGVAGDASDASDGNYPNDANHVNDDNDGNSASAADVLVCVYSNQSALFWRLVDYRSFTITHHAQFVFLSKPQVFVGVRGAQGDANTLSIFTYDCHRQSKILWGKLQRYWDEDAHEKGGNQDTLIDLVEMGRRKVVFFQSSQGAIRAVDVGGECSQVIGVLERILSDTPTLTHVEIVKPRLCTCACSDDAIAVHVLRCTLHSVSLDMLTVGMSGDVPSTNLSDAKDVKDASNASNTNTNTSTPTPMLLRNRSRKGGAGTSSHSQTEEGVGYPLANHGFSRRVSAAKGENGDGCSTCTHTHPLTLPSHTSPLHLDARFNTCATFTDCVVGVCRNGRSWEAWRVALSHCEDAVVERRSFEVGHVRDVRGVRSEFAGSTHSSGSSSAHRSSNRPRLESLGRRRGVSSTPMTHAILPTSRILTCQAISDTQILIVFSNAVVALEFNNSTTANMKKEV